MYVDVVDVFGLHFSIFKGSLHNEVCTQAFGVRSCDVVCVSRHTYACNFAINLCATCFSVLQFFEDKDTCTFAHDKTITALAEGTWSMSRIIVASRECVHRVEATYTAGPNSSFGTTSNHCIGLAQTNEVKGICQGIGWRGTSRGSGVVRAVETILNRNLSWSNVSNHFGDEEGVELRTFILVHGIVTSFFFEGVNTTDTNTKYHTNAVFVDSFEVPATVLDSLHSSNECILFVEVHLASLFAIDKVSSFEVLHFASKLSFKQRSVEVCDRASTANAILNVFPSFGHCVTNGSKGTEASYNNSFEFHKNVCFCFYKGVAFAVTAMLKAQVALFALCF